MTYDLDYPQGQCNVSDPLQVLRLPILLGNKISCSDFTQWLGFTITQEANNICSPLNFHDMNFQEIHRLQTTRPGFVLKGHLK